MPTQAGQISEDFDSLLRKLNTNTSTIGDSSNKSSSEGNNTTRVIKQKDDVVYITEPSLEWKFWSPVRVGGENGALAIVIAL